MKKGILFVLCAALILCTAGCMPNLTPPDSSLPEELPAAPAAQIEKIDITIDNWDDYFEIGYHHILYTDGPDGNPVKISAHTGLTLKEGYRIALDDPTKQTSVTFDTDIEYRYYFVDYDFENNTFHIDKPSGNNHVLEDQKTSVFNNECCEQNIKASPRGIRTIGQGWMGEVENGERQEEQICVIKSVTKAEGVLYAYVE